MPLPEEAAKSAKATHDLLRRFKELGTNMKSHPPPSAIEQDLQAGILRSRSVLLAMHAAHFCPENKAPVHVR